MLRQLILEEPDQLDAEEFMVKLEVWLKVLEKSLTVYSTTKE